MTIRTTVQHLATNAKAEWNGTKFLLLLIGGAVFLVVGTTAFLINVFWPIVQRFP